MRKPSLTTLAICGFLLAANVALAGPDIPHRFAPWSLDRGLVSARAAVDGRMVSVWSYRFAGQYDLAISVREADAPSWSEPVFLGSGDGFQQEQPSIATDAAGNFYVAFAIRETGQIFLTTLAQGSNAWSTPVAVTATPGRRSAPLVRLVAGRLVIAFRTGAGIEMVDLAPLADRVNANGIQDGPDTLPHQKDPPPEGDENDGALGKR